MKCDLREIHHQPSWQIATRQMQLAVTRQGGQMAPVTFHRDTKKPVQPYYISPWQGEGLTIADDPVLEPLRGDFFCMPFGAPTRVGKLKHFCHGVPATRNWDFVAADRAEGITSLTLTIRDGKLGGQITKGLYLVEGQNVVYSQHMLRGFDCRTSLGHHATLAMCEKPGSVLLAHSPMRFGMTNPTRVGHPEERQYDSIEINKRFRSLEKVPLKFKNERYGDFSALPARRGYTDLIGLFNKPGNVAWSAATFTDGGYLWFALKDPAVQPTLLLWVSNRGRHNRPWWGRNCCLGMEDVCGFFAEGRKDSIRANLLTRAGVPTWVKLSPKRPTVVNYIQGVVRVPKAFGRVADAELESGKVTFHSETGRKATAEVCWDFLKTGRIA